MAILKNNNLYSYTSYLKSIPGLPDEECNKEITEAIMSDPRCATEEGSIAVAQEYFDDGYTMELLAQTNYVLVANYIRMKYLKVIAEDPSKEEIIMRATITACQNINYELYDSFIEAYYDEEDDDEWDDDDEDESDEDLEESDQDEESEDTDDYQTGESMPPDEADHYVEDLMKAFQRNNELRNEFLEPADALLTVLDIDLKEVLFPYIEEQRAFYQRVFGEYETEKIELASKVSAMAIYMYIIYSKEDLLTLSYRQVHFDWKKIREDVNGILKERYKDYDVDKLKELSEAFFIPDLPLSLSQEDIAFLGKILKEGKRSEFDDDEIPPTFIKEPNKVVKDISKSSSVNSYEDAFAIYSAINNILDPLTKEKTTVE